jgi:hypothetical protein
MRQSKPALRIVRHLLDRHVPRTARPLLHHSIPDWLSRFIHDDAANRHAVFDDQDGVRRLQRLQGDFLSHFHLEASSQASRDEQAAAAIRPHHVNVQRGESTQLVNCGSWVESIMRCP